MNLVGCSEAANIALCIEGRLYLNKVLQLFLGNTKLSGSGIRYPLFFWNVIANASLITF